MGKTSNWRKSSRWISLLLSGLLVVTLAGCGASESVPEQSQSSSQAQESTMSGENTSQAASASESTTAKNDTVAVVYFSGTGNTQAIAQTMADILDAPIYEIVPEEPYTEDDLAYNNDDCRANREQQDDTARPAIASDLSEVTEYDTIYLGYPIWWGTNPKIIRTFLESYDLAGATVYPFCTSGGSGIETSVSSLQSAYPDLSIAAGHRFQANAAEEDILAWLDKAKQ